VVVLVLWLGKWIMMVVLMVMVMANDVIVRLSCGLRRIWRTNTHITLLYEELGMEREHLEALGRHVYGLDENDFSPFASLCHHRRLDLAHGLMSYTCNKLTYLGDYSNSL